MQPWRRVIFLSEVLEDFPKRLLHCHQTVILLLLLLKNTSCGAQQDTDWQRIHCDKVITPT